MRLPQETLTFYLNRERGKEYSSRLQPSISTVVLGTSVQVRYSTRYSISLYTKSKGRGRSYLGYRKCYHAAHLVQLYKYYIELKCQTSYEIFRTRTVIFWLSKMLLYCLCYQHKYLVFLITYYIIVPVIILDPLSITVTPPVSHVSTIIIIIIISAH